MSWKAADYREVLEQYLRAARLDLLDDPRLARGCLPGQCVLAPELTERVVREKLAAAAQHGFEAVESSLRLEAQNELVEAGVDPARLREVLDAAAGLMVPPPPPALASLPKKTGANVAAGLTFAAVALLELILFLLLDLHPVLLLGLLFLAAIPAFMVRNWQERLHAGPREQLRDEYPSALCRHYVEALQELVQVYEDRVNAQLSESPGRVGIS